MYKDNKSSKLLTEQWADQVVRDNRTVFWIILNSAISYLKQSLIIPLILIFEITLTPRARAEKFGDFEFSGSSIIAYTGSGGEVIIPSAINGMPVMSIGAEAFLDNVSLISVTIPGTVTSIDEKAFRGCDKLTSVTIPVGVKSIGYQSFYGCKSLADVAVPESVNAIGMSAFYGCSSLSSVVIGDGVASIGSNAFRGCSSLTGITIPSSVTLIMNDAFAECIELRNLIISNGVVRIDAAFTGCTALTDVIIPDSVTTIGNAAFYGCSSLRNVVIGSGVNFIGPSAFAINTLSYVIFLGDAPNFVGNNAFYDGKSFRVIYYKDRLGFTLPTWHGYLTEMRDAPIVPTLVEWREAYFGTGAINAGEAADASDPDGDGQTNVQEYAAGTHPNKAESVFQAQSAMKAAASYTTSVYAQITRRYRLQRMVVASDVKWQTVAIKQSPLTAALISLTDYAAPEKAAIYRILVELP